MGALTGLLWGGFVRLFLVGQSMSVINSFLHLVGSRSFNTQDGSRNAAALGLPLWGEAWHNNHHAFPYSAAFGLAWYQLDPGFWLIRSLQASGLAWNIKLPSAGDVERRRNKDAAGWSPEREA
jgi:stearoyl-CoA desaturase (delta-9 desaturase)